MNPREELERRVLDKSIDAITDPDLKRQALLYRSGQSNTADFVRFLDFSPTAQRGMARFADKLMDMTDEEREEMLASVEEQIRKLAAPEQPRPRGQDEENFEDIDWLHGSQ